MVQANAGGLNWIKAQLIDDQRHGCCSSILQERRRRRGFRDYVSWGRPENDAGLLSGTADYELSDLFHTPDEQDPRAGRNYRSDPRLYALGHWKKRIFGNGRSILPLSCNMDMARSCLLPLMAESVVVVDEVHSFDKSMFSTLKFLTEFVDVPVLCSERPRTSR